MRLDHLLSKEHTPATVSECLAALGGVSLVESSMVRVLMFQLVWGVGGLVTHGPALVGDGVKHTVGS